MRFTISCGKFRLNSKNVRVVNALRSQRNPRVVRVVEPMPMGSKPQVCPKALWLIDNSCSPFAQRMGDQFEAPTDGNRKRGSYRVKDPRDVVIRDREN